MDRSKITGFERRNNLPKRRIRPFFALLGLLLYFAHGGDSTVIAQQPKPERYEQLGSAMGVRTLMVAYATSDEIAAEAFSAATRRIEALEQALSNYRDTSEVSLLASYKICRAYRVSADLWRVLQLSREINRDTQGAFDPALGAISLLWRQARANNVVPHENQVRAALAKSGFQHLHLDSQRQTICFSREQIGLDFGAIGKGHAADEALKEFQSRGIRSAMVEIGGDIALGEPPPDKKGWRIAVRAPDASLNRFLELADCGVATSGDSQQFLQAGDRRFSHLIDPRTGWAIERQCHVTVVAESAAYADALASAFSVMDEPSALRLANQRGRDPPQGYPRGRYRADSAGGRRDPPGGRRGGRAAAPGQRGVRLSRPLPGVLAAWRSGKRARRRGAAPAV